MKKVYITIRYEGSVVANDITRGEPVIVFDEGKTYIYENDGTTLLFCVPNSHLIEVERVGDAD